MLLRYLCGVVPLVGRLLVRANEIPVKVLSRGQGRGDAEKDDGRLHRRPGTKIVVDVVSVVAEARYPFYTSPLNGGPVDFHLRWCLLGNGTQCPKKEPHTLTTKSKLQKLN